MPTWTMFAKAPMKMLVPHSLRQVVRRWTATAAPGYPFHALQTGKLEAIDFAVRHCGVQSFADLGGVWNVDGGYSFYALGAHGLPNGCLVDHKITPAVDGWRARYPGLRTIRGHFGTEAVAAQVGRVDAVFMFDILLHQVNPDWDATLGLYARRTDCFVIVNPQYHARKTFRLLDRGRDEYLRHVPRRRDDDHDFRMAFGQPDAVHPVLGCRFRDSASIWQWGITDDDLIAKMKSLGFGLRYFKYCGTWAMPHVETHAFVFVRATEPTC